jgi:hypothetical protein
MADDGTRAEGWYRDPFGRNEGRWFSEGTPTALVRDGSVEVHDPPPDEPVPGPLVELGSSTLTDGSDLLRADHAEENRRRGDHARRGGDRHRGFVPRLEPAGR